MIKDNSLQYFGTNLTSAGHYFWEVGSQSLYSSRTQFGDTPFNPEGLPHRDPGQMLKKGHVEFYQFAGYSIIAIEGSCKDSRPGSKSVFFVRSMVTKSDLKKAILSIPITRQIIETMSFPIDWQTW